MVREQEAALRRRALPGEPRTRPVRRSVEIECRDRPISQENGVALSFRSDFRYPPIIRKVCALNS